MYTSNSTCTYSLESFTEMYMSMCVGLHNNVTRFCHDRMLNYYLPHVSVIKFLIFESKYNQTAMIYLRGTTD